MKRGASKKKGFTLVELIVVIAILAILAAILIPIVSGYISDAQAATDTANLRTLNVATQCYGIKRNITSGDIFEGISTDSERMQMLITGGYIMSEVKPQQPNVSFTWDIPTQKWTTGSGSTPVESSETPSPSVSTVAVKSVRLDKNNIVISYPPNGGPNGVPKTLTATVLPADATNKAVTWSSSNPGIATVNANGTVSFVSPGTATITVTTVDGGKTDSCSVRAQW